jgi:TonB family protein
MADWEIRQHFLGKTLYLRDCYLDNSLHFDAAGKLTTSSPRTSYTLSLVEIQRVRADKHKVELEGVRYGVHFLGLLASEDQSNAMEKISITDKKSPLKIEIDRDEFNLTKQEKKALNSKPAQPNPAQPSSSQPAASDSHTPGLATSVEQANKDLRAAFDRIFAPATLDDRMIASLPAYWQLYYRAIEAKADYRPSDPSVLRQSQVDQKARLLQAFDPPSNEYAQHNAIVGLAMYHVVVGTDGKPTEIAVGRPIGFGLDESAVESIRKATFQPAIKQGQPVPVLVDLTVRFRIYSNLTSTPAAPQADADKPQPPTLPGPDTANQKPQ